MSWLREIVRILRGLIGELSDQNAYQRHLAAHGATHSPEEWRNFQDQRWAVKGRQGRCC